MHVFWLLICIRTEPLFSFILKRIHTYIHTYIHTRTHLVAYLFRHRAVSCWRGHRKARAFQQQQYTTSTYAYIHTYTHIHTYSHTDVCACVYVCAFVESPVGPGAVGISGTLCPRRAARHPNPTRQQCRGRYRSDEISELQVQRDGHGHDDIHRRSVSWGRKPHSIHIHACTFTHIYIQTRNLLTLISS